MADLARIKNNVAKMAAQGAPEEDIDGYIASEGVTVDDVRAFRPQQPQAAPPEAAPETFDPYKGGIFTPVQGLASTFGALTAGSHSGLMAGFDDELTALTNPGDYAQLQAQADAAKAKRRSEHPVASVAGEIAGGLALGSVPGKAGLTLAGKSLPVVGKTGAAMLEGGAYGGLYGAGEAKPGERLAGAGTGAAIGAAAGGGLELAGRGVSRAIAGKSAKVPARASSDLATEVDDFYARSRQAGITVKADAFERVAKNAEFAAGRLNDKLRPQTMGALDDINALRGKDISLEELDELRQTVGNAMDGAQKQDIRTLSRIKTVIDHFTDNPKPGDFTGDVRGFELIKEGRKLAAKKAKTQMLEEIVEKARNQATGFEAGLVNQFRTLANNAEKMKRFTPQEQAMIKGVVRRISPHGVLRALGMLSPGSTFGGLITGGSVVGAGILPGMALAGAGAAAKYGAGAITKGKVDRLMGAVSTGQAPVIPQLPNHLRKFIPGAAAASMGTGQSLATSPRR